ncbi:protein PML isoform X2 [Monodelphis domestica]|uniref:protein PML isoform X2 n=1 Tax=Monodelphis domestica TaxID=13616 RepID=UPI0024E2749C|nr:protein PML isoform X2 [Monodelphis domestica]
MDGWMVPQSQLHLRRGAGSTVLEKERESKRLGSFPCIHTHPGGLPRPSPLPHSPAFQPGHLGEALPRGTGLPPHQGPAASWSVTSSRSPAGDRQGKRRSQKKLHRPVFFLRAPSSPGGLCLAESATDWGLTCRSPALEVPQGCTRTPSNPRVSRPGGGAGYLSQAWILGSEEGLGRSLPSGIAFRSVIQVGPAQGGQMSQNEKESGSPAENRSRGALSTPAEAAPSTEPNQTPDPPPPKSPSPPILVSVASTSTWSFRTDPVSSSQPETSASGSASSRARAMEAIGEEFCFLLCHVCKMESKCPKLLSCLHTVCSKCLESHEPAGQCPICRDSHPQDSSLRSMDNLFFESLQRRISVYQHIVQGGDEASCNRCREPADFWCFECEQLICTHCFEAHQWFVKHEARSVEELRKETAKDFLDGTRKSNNLFCPNPTHRTPSLTSIYCRGCAKPICCTCALLDSSHKDQYCAISSEIQQRQEELSKITSDLKTQEQIFNDAHNKIKSAVSHLEEVKKETEELIRSQVQVMVEHIQAKEKELLETMENQYQENHQQMAGKLRHLNSMLQRIQNGEVLVEKLQHYASDQEVLEMHTFIREALEHLSREKPLNLQAAVKVEEFVDCKAKLQALYTRVTKEKDPEVAKIETTDKKEEPMEPTTFTTEISDSDSQDEKKSQKPGHIGDNTTEPPRPTVPSRKRKSVHANKPTSRKVIKKEYGENGRHRTNKVFKQPGASTSRANQVVKLDPHHGPTNPAPSSESRSTAESNNGSRTLVELDNPIVVISSSDESEETESSSDFGDSSDSEDIVECTGSTRAPLSHPTNNFRETIQEDRALVFFDLKVDSKTKKISQLAAVNGENNFRIIIQQEEALFSLFSRGVAIEDGLQNFLCYLRSSSHPILAGYKLWSPNLTVFFKALETFSKKGEFHETVSGFLDILPLIRDRVPGADSYKLKNLVKIYLSRNMNDNSALASVRAMRDLCKILHIYLGQSINRRVLPFSNLDCFASLQPLVRVNVLTRAQAKLLALRNVSLTELQAAVHDDPEWGLRKYSRYLASRSSRSFPSLLGLRTYLEGLLSNPKPEGKQATGPHQGPPGKGPSHA